LGMVINNKIYQGVGYTDQAAKTNQFWEYDPAAAQWTRKADFPGEPRNHGIGFSVAGKGYAGTGLYHGMSGLKDWWQYDPITDALDQENRFSRACPSLSPWVCTQWKNLHRDGRLWLQGLVGI